MTQTEVLHTATPTPVERHGDHWVKRDDMFRVGDSCGGKVRICLQLATAGRDQGAHTLVTAGSRHSPQVTFAGIGLDPIYEAKCVRFLLAGDLFWIVGRRGTATQ